MTASESAYRAALAFVEERSKYASGFISNPSSGPGRAPLGLLRTRAVLDELGSPDRAFPIVHIAGSKGKGSTAACVASIASAAGYRCGLTTSPHLHSFRERIVIDGVPIDRGAFTGITEAVRSAIDTIEHQHPELGAITAFELLVVMALLAFARSECDIAVVEVGLGGTFDATNVIESSVSIITRLDLEHISVLGDTLASIAENKAGIIKPGIPVISDRQSSEAMTVIERVAREQASPLLVASRDFHSKGSWRGFDWANRERTIAGLRTGMAGAHQMENAALAIAAWRELANQGFVASDEALRRGVRTAALPGRFERVRSEGRTIVLDGAHTPYAAAALATEILAEFGRPVGVIVGLLQDKSPGPFFDALSPAIASLILTAPRSPRAIPTVTLLHTVDAANSQTITSPDMETSLATARSQFPEDLPIVITGSLSLVAEARELLGLATPDS